MADKEFDQALPELGKEAIREAVNSPDMPHSVKVSLERVNWEG